MGGGGTLVHRLLFGASLLLVGCFFRFIFGRHALAKVWEDACQAGALLFVLRFGVAPLEGRAPTTSSTEVFVSTFLGAFCGAWSALLQSRIVALCIVSVAVLLIHSPCPGKAQRADAVTSAGACLPSLGFWQLLLAAFGFVCRSASGGGPGCCLAAAVCHTALLVTAAELATMLSGPASTSSRALRSEVDSYVEDSEAEEAAAASEVALVAGLPGSPCPARGGARRGAANSPAPPQPSRFGAVRARVPPLLRSASTGETLWLSGVGVGSRAVAPRRRGVEQTACCDTSAYASTPIHGGPVSGSAATRRAPSPPLPGPLRPTTSCPSRVTPAAAAPLASAFAAAAAAAGVSASSSSLAAGASSHHSHAQRRPHSRPLPPFTPGAANPPSQPTTLCRSMDSVSRLVALASASPAAPQHQQQGRQLLPSLPLPLPPQHLSITSDTAAMTSELCAGCSPSPGPSPSSGELGDGTAGAEGPSGAGAPEHTHGLEEDGICCHTAVHGTASCGEPFHALGVTHMGPGQAQAQHAERAEQDRCAAESKVEGAADGALEHETRDERDGLSAGDLDAARFTAADQGIAEAIAHHRSGSVGTDGFVGTSPRPGGSAGAGAEVPGCAPGMNGSGPAPPPVPCQQGIVELSPSLLPLPPMPWRALSHERRLTNSTHDYILLASTPPAKCVGGGFPQKRGGEDEEEEEEEEYDSDAYDDDDSDGCFSLVIDGNAVGVPDISGGPFATAAIAALAAAEHLGDGGAIGGGGGMGMDPQRKQSAAKYAHLLGSANAGGGYGGPALPYLYSSELGLHRSSYGLTGLAAAAAPLLPDVYGCDVADLADLEDLMSLEEVEAVASAAAAAAVTALPADVAGSELGVAEQRRLATATASAAARRPPPPRLDVSFGRHDLGLSSCGAAVATDSNCAWPSPAAAQMATLAPTQHEQQQQQQQSAYHAQQPLHNSACGEWRGSGGGGGGGGGNPCLLGGELAGGCGSVAVACAAPEPRGVAAWEPRGDGGGGGDGGVVPLKEETLATHTAATHSRDLALQRMMRLQSLQVWAQTAPAYVKGCNGARGAAGGRYDEVVAGFHGVADGGGEAEDPCGNGGDALGPVPSLVSLDLLDSFLRDAVLLADGAYGIVYGPDCDVPHDEQARGADPDLLTQQPRLRQQQEQQQQWYCEQMAAAQLQYRQMKAEQLTAAMLHQEQVAVMRAGMARQAAAPEAQLMGLQPQLQQQQQDQKARAERQKVRRALHDRQPSAGQLLARAAYGIATATAPPAPLAAAAEAVAPHVVLHHHPGDQPPLLAPSHSMPQPLPQPPLHLHQSLPLHHSLDCTAAHKHPPAAVVSAPPLPLRQSLECAAPGALGAPYRGGALPGLSAPAAGCTVVGLAAGAPGGQGPLWDRFGAALGPRPAAAAEAVTVSAPERTGPQWGLAAAASDCGHGDQEEEEETFELDERGEVQAGCPAGRAVTASPQAYTQAQAQPPGQPHAVAPLARTAGPATLIDPFSSVGGGTPFRSLPRHRHQQSNCQQQQLDAQGRLPSSHRGIDTAAAAAAGGVSRGLGGSVRAPAAPAGPAARAAADADVSGGAAAPLAPASSGVEPSQPRPQLPQLGSSGSESAHGAGADGPGPEAEVGHVVAEPDRRAAHAAGAKASCPNAHGFFINGNGPGGNTDAAGLTSVSREQPPSLPNRLQQQLCGAGDSAAVPEPPEAQAAGQQAAEVPTALSPGTSVVTRLTLPSEGWAHGGQQSGHGGLLSPRTLVSSAIASDDGSCACVQKCGCTVKQG